MAVHIFKMLELGADDPGTFAVALFEGGSDDNPRRRLL